MRVVIAARLSRLGGNGQDGIGIETQDQRAREWAEREGHEVIAVVADTKSGTVAPWDRKYLKPWVTDSALMARYDAILAYKNDRLSRGMWSDEARIRQWAEDHGKRLMIVDGPQWPPRNDGDEWSWEAMSKMARKEWEAIRERSMRAQQELKSRGSLIGRPPFGYTTGGERYARYLVPTDEGLLIVPQIYARVIKGESLPAIGRWLDAEGVKPTSGTRWWPKSLGELIRNPTYRGQRCEQDPKTKRYGRMLHKCEPIVDAATWKRANDNLDARPKRGKVYAKDRAMLSGALRCPVCDDSPMYPIKAGRGNTHLYYRCSGRGPQRKGCGLMVQAAKVDAAVDGFFTQYDLPVTKLVPQAIPDHEPELQTLRYDKQQVALKGLSRDEERAEMDRIWAEIERIENLIKEEEEAGPAEPEEEETDEFYSEIWAALTTPERGPWLVATGSKVTASKTEVTVRLANGYESTVAI
jgi:site-specific DNA recombinase